MKSPTLSPQDYFIRNSATHMFAIAPVRVMEDYRPLLEIVYFPHETHTWEEHEYADKPPGWILV